MIRPVVPAGGGAPPTNTARGDERLDGITGEAVSPFVCDDGIARGE